MSFNPNQVRRYGLFTGLFLLLLFSRISTAQAQRFVIRGTVADSAGGGLPSVTIMLMNESDSSLAGFAAGNVSGYFELKTPSEGPFMLKINYTGFETLIKRVSKPEQTDILDLGTLPLRQSRKMLDEVVVKGEAIPVTIKKDTIEFNAQSFKVVPNANVEQLLKKLPGVEVDAEGNVTAQGKQVQRIMVDGKDFFGGKDPKLATKNLPADAIAKVQVFEKKSETADFTGIDDGTREQTINLELKEDRKNGTFGKVEGGIGDNERYKARLSLNRFSKGNQLSVLGVSNNINEPGFGIQDYLNFQGTSAGGGGRGFRTLSNTSGNLLNFGQRQNGIMQNYAGGVNINRSLSKKTELNTSYLYNQLNHDLRTNLLRENFLDSGSFVSRDETRQNNTNFNHRLNATVEHKIDSLNSLRFTSSIGYNETYSTIQNNTSSFGAENVRVNSGDRRTESYNSSLNNSNTLLYRHKFAKRGRTFTSNGNFGFTERNTESELNAVNRFGENTNLFTQNLLQNNDSRVSTRNYGAGFTYTEPIARRLYWETNYNYTQNDNDTRQDVFNTDSAGRVVVNPQLTNKFNSSFRYHKPGMNLRLNRSKYSATLGLSFQRTQLLGNLPLFNTRINRTFENLLPVARFNYDFSSSKRLTMDYETNIQEPSIQQLQPLIDNTDPLNISTGNPNLKPAYRHNLRGNYFYFDPVKFLSVFASANMTYETNAIVSSQSVDNRFIRTTKPVNVGENIRLNANLNFSFPIKKIESRIRLGGNASTSQGPNLLNNIESKINQRNLGGNFNYQYNYKEFFEQNLGFRINYQQSQFSFNSEQDQTFFNQNLTANSIFTIKKKNILNAELDYQIYRNLNNGFYQELPLMNINFSRLMLKNDRGELKLSMINALDRNLGVTQEANVNFIETTRTNNLGRIYMVSFIYSLNKHLDMMNQRGPNQRIMRMMR
jgi:hypothetical protein